MFPNICALHKTSKLTHTKSIARKYHKGGISKN